MKPQSCEGADGLTADSSDEELIRVTALVTDHLCEGTRNELVASLESGMEAQETIKTDLDARLSQQEAKQSEMEFTISALVKSMQASYEALGALMVYQNRKEGTGGQSVSPIEELLRSNKETLGRLVDRYDDQVVVKQGRASNAHRKARPVSAAVTRRRSPLIDVLPMAHESRHCLDEFIDVLKRSFSTPEEAYQYFSDGAIGFSREMFALRLKTLDDAG
ncbi:hypothetical protein Pmar_PMAR021252, partial [Perkinsus marinus ATCC 50983]